MVFKGYRFPQMGNLTFFSPTQNRVPLECRFDPGHRYHQ